MDKRVLMDFETFDEFPDKYLCVNKDSSYYFIRKENETFVAKRNIELISSNGYDDTYIIFGYYNVLDGSLVFKTKIINKNNKKTIEDCGAQVFLLSKILNIKNNSSPYLSKEDIENIVALKETDQKVYSNYLKEKKLRLT